MKISEIAAILSAKVLTADTDLEHEVFAACGSDMMSDVLAFVKNQAVLLTGLNNPQVVRTAEMMDMVCIVFVRGKTPDEVIVDMANKKSIAVLSTEKTLYKSCGLLYKHGLGAEE
ncbi:MAG: DRTGG domain-containing protein [Oscillospiraceae bacterium]|nr:DRTGG domain-containing protein [Oscillospiraceae bacterium]